MTVKCVDCKRPTFKGHTTQGRCILCEEQRSAGGKRTPKRRRR